MPIRLLAVVLVLSGCSTGAYIRADVTDNPLHRVAQQAQKDWSVERVDANTLNIRNTWPIHRVFSFGYIASHANLVYDPAASALNIRRISWLRCSSPSTPMQNRDSLGAS